MSLQLGSEALAAVYAVARGTTRLANLCRSDQMMKRIILAIKSIMVMVIAFSSHDSTDSANSDDDDEEEQVRR